MKQSGRHHAVLTVGMCLVVLFWSPVIQAADSLLVAKVHGDLAIFEIARYDGETGAFVDIFIPEGTGGLVLACCLTWGPDRNLYVGDPFNARILKFGPTGAYLGEFIPPGYGGLGLMLDLIFGPDGNFYVGDFERGGILRYDGATGTFIDEFVPPGGPLQPWDQQFMTFGPDGNLYIVAGNQVLRFQVPSGAFLGAFATVSEDWGSGLAFGEDGSLYVTNVRGSDLIAGVDRFDGNTGTFIDHFVPMGSGGLINAIGLAFGPDDNLYVASSESNEVLRYDGQTGAFIDQFATGAMGPTGIAFSPKFDVCHTSRRGLKTRTLSLGHLSLDDHIGHGDALGPCPGSVRGGSPIVHQTGGE